MTEAFLQFAFLKNSKGIQHWFVQRISALSFFALFLIVYVTNSLVLGSFSIFFLVWHISYGLETSKKRSLLSHQHALKLRGG